MAIEVMPPPLAADRGFRERLAAEAARAAVLEHPLIVRVHEAVVGAGGELALITDPYRGVPLAAIAAAQGMPLAAAMLVADSVLLALAQAHRAGIVHGAVAPETVLVDGAGRICLAGFALGAALHPGMDGEPSRDGVAVATLVRGQLRSGQPGAAERPVSRRLQSVLRRATAETPERRYRTASGMRAALAAVARDDAGPGWREQAAAELAALASGRGTGGEGEPPDLLLDLAPTEPSGSDEAPPPAGLPVAPVIRGVPERRRPRSLRRALVAAELVAACVVLGVTAGLIVSAVRGGGSAAGGPLQVGSPLSLNVEPAAGSCNSVFIATATGPVQGHGTLVYRWERSDGLSSANTPLSVSSADGSFLITQHWELNGAVSHPAITFRVVSPVAMTVTRRLQYSCP